MNERPSPKDLPAESSRPAWARYSLGGNDEDFIVGSPDGLRELRDHIDEAIQSGASIIQNTQIEIIGVRCSKSLSNVPPKSQSWELTLNQFGYFALVFAILALAAYGVIALCR